MYGELLRLQGLFVKICSKRLFNIDVVVWFINESIARFSSDAANPEMLNKRPSAQDEKLVLCW